MIILDLLKNIYEWLNKIGGSYKGSEYTNGITLFFIIFIWILLKRIIKKNKDDSNTK